VLNDGNNWRNQTYSPRSTYSSMLKVTGFRYFVILPDPVNRSTLEVIETAQGVFSLDKACPQEEAEHPGASTLRYWDQHKTMLANRFLHGNGCRNHSCNRWFDHAVQVHFQRGVF